MDHSCFLDFFCDIPPLCFDDVLAEDGELLHVLPNAVHLNFFLWTSSVDHSGPFLFSELFCGTPSPCLKVIGVVGGVLAPKIFESAPVPFWPNRGWN